MKLPAAFLCAIFSPAAVHAQAMLELAPPTCAQCRIEMQRAATIGTPGDAFGIDFFGTTIAQADNGEFWVASSVNPGEIGIFDSRGAHLRTFGRRGRGPDEFRAITRISRVAGVGVAVMDQGNNRITVVHSGGPSVHLHVPGVGHDILFTRQGYIVQGTIPSPERFGYYLHRYGSDQQLVESFAPAGETMSRYMSYAPRAVAVRPNGHILVAERGKYRISEIDARGSVARVYSRSVPWFDPWDEPRSGEPLGAPPRPTLADIAVGDDGLLWVLHYVASSRWRPVSREAREKWVPDDIYDSIIELIDLDSGTVLASIRTTQLISRFLAPGSGYALRQTASGDVVADVWRFTFHR